jgi:hypothetical protein
MQWNQEQVAAIRELDVSVGFRSAAESWMEDPITGRLVQDPARPRGTFVDVYDRLTNQLWVSAFGANLDEDQMFPLAVAKARQTPRPLTAAQKRDMAAGRTVGTDQGAELAAMQAELAAYKARFGDIDSPVTGEGSGGNELAAAQARVATLETELDAARGKSKGMTTHTVKGGREVF